MRNLVALCVVSVLAACGPSRSASDAGPSSLVDDATDSGIVVSEQDAGENTVSPEVDGGTDAGIPVDAGCTTYPPISTSTQGALTVTIYDGFGRFDLNASAIHHRADGSVVSSGKPNANGEVTFQVQGGDAISVVHDYNYSKEVFTWLAVQPGDKLVAGVSQKPLGLSPWGMAQLLYPGSVPNAVSYRASVGCETSYTSVSTTFPNPLLFLDKPCNGATGNYVPMLGAAYDSNNRMLAYVATPFLPLTNSSTQGYVATYRPNAWKTDFITLTATADNTRSEERLEASAEMLTSGNERFGLPAVVGNVLGSHEVRIPLGLGTLYHHLFAVNVIGNVRGTRRVNVLKTGNPPTQWGGPVEEFFLPEILETKGEVMASDSTRREIQWTSAACMKNAHAVLATTRWFVGTDEYRWTLVSPPTHGPIRTLELPPEFAAHLPPPDATLTPSVAVFHSSRLSGWNDYRYRFTELPKVREERLLDRTLFPGVDHELRLSIMF